VPAEVILPKQNPNDDAAEVLRWLAADGDRVVDGDDLVEVESTKSVTVITSPGAGYLRQLAAEGDVVPTGAPIALLCSTPEELAATTTDPEPRAGGPAPAGPRFSAEGQRELQRLGLDAGLFRGRGLVTGAMVRSAADELAQAGPAVRRVPIGPAKQTEISRLYEGAAALASALTVAFSADVLDRAPADGEIPPLPLALIIHALADALTEFPELNARFAGDHVEQYTDINIGVAVDAGHGLRVPVIKNADRLGPQRITLDLLDLLAAYHQRGLHTEDVSGATVTVSDLSGRDILQFQPRINQDQALAVGIGADTSLPGRPMTLTAVFDHRVSSGRAVADFLTGVRTRLLEQR
jgi:pyruvate/2-oxoglutarate dehydrogenase complex dihydrolipoamide acyltransferase (E2) component